MDSPASRILTKDLQVQDLRQDRKQYRIVAVVVRAVTIPAVIAVLIAAAKTLAKIVLILRHIKVIARVSPGRVLIGINIRVAVTPPIFPIGHSGSIAFLIAIVNGLLQIIDRIVIDLIVSAAPVVAIRRSRVEVRIVIVVIVVAVLVLLIAKALQIITLKTCLGRTPLLL